MRKINPDLIIEYHVCMATERAMDKIEEKGVFNRVRAVFELDQSFKAFGENSRFFPAHLEKSLVVSKEDARRTALKYGRRLCDSDPLGYKRSQLLVGFHHNIPNNTLPIIWTDEPGEWCAIFPRYAKKGELG